MHTRLSICVTLAVVAALPGTTSAQDPGPLPGARIEQLLKETPPIRRALPAEPPSSNPVKPEDCDAFVLAPRIDPTDDATKLTKIAGCLDLVNDALKRTATAASGADVNGEIIQLRINYKRLKRWIPDRPKAAESSEWLSARKAQLRVGRQLPITLKKHDLFATFSAVLVTGATLVDASQPEEADAKQSAAATGSKKADGADQGA